MIRKGVIGKRGYFYLFSVIFFLVVILALFWGSDVMVSEKIAAQQTRVRTIDSFLTDLNEDISRAAYISGFRALIALEQHIVDSGEYLDDVESQFVHVFVDGDVNGTVYDVMVNSSFSEYLVNVNHHARRMGISVNITVTNITMYQVGPWELAVDFNCSFNVSDIRSQAVWLYDRKFSVTIPIYDLRDPLYSVETYGKTTNTIRSYEFSEFVDDAGDMNDTTVLAAILDDSYYVQNPHAPSFLNRLEGDFSADQYGIESFVNIQDLNDQSIPTHSTRSVVDYIYFTTPDSDDWCDIQNMPSFFKLDDDHLQFYEVDPELEYNSCP